MLSPGSNSSRPRGSFRIGLAAELAIFRMPKVMLASVAIIFVPALFVLIYMSSVWDPYGNLCQLPAALVNQDIPVMYAGREVNVGGQIVATMEKQRSVTYIRFDTAEAARAAVRAGDVYTALIIPADFSRQAMTSGQPAQLELYVSEGGNFTAAVLSKRLGSELARAINEKIGAERWAALVGGTGQAEETTLLGGLLALQTGGRQLADGAGKLHAGSLQLREGLGRAQEGSGKLADGSVQLADGASRLADGMKQVEVAVTSMRSKLPDDQKLGELARGSRALADGTAELNRGLIQINDGVVRIEAGAGELQKGAARVPFVGGKLSAGAGKLREGIVTLGDGTARASKGATQLSEGMNQLDAGIQPLSTGLIQLNAGLATMGEKLPPPEQLELFDRSMGTLRDGNVSLLAGLKELNDGAGRLEAGALELANGSGRLAGGLDEAATRFEAGFGGIPAAKLAAPVMVQLETTASVPQYGPALAPYFSCLSLWGGAVMMSIVFYLRRLPDTMQSAPRPVKWFAKMLPLLVLGVLQATVVIVMLGVLFRIHFDHPYLVWLVAVIGSLVFVSMMMLFVSILGDAGRLLAVVLLILQLAASGGIYPIELSGDFYQKAHGVLPFTYMIRAFRAVMFTAFEGRWASPAGVLALFGLAGGLISVLLARWKYVPKESYGPAVEF